MNHLKRMVQHLWQRDEVLAVWLGGSFGSGRADRYSDVDLRLAVKASAVPGWHRLNVEEVFGRRSVNVWTSVREDDAALHHVLLDNAEMYDLWVQDSERTLHQEPKLVIGCRDQRLARRLAAPSSEPRFEFEDVDPAKLEGALGMYWSNHVKNEKVIYRNLTLMLRDAIYLFTGILLRFKFVLATGKDCGNVTFPPMTIHAATPALTVLRNAFGNDFLSGMVPNVWSQREAVESVDRLDAAIGATGRELAEKYRFAYPHELERVVLKSWKAFKTREDLSLPEKVSQ